MTRLTRWILPLVLLSTTHVFAAGGTHPSVKALYEQATPSLVAVEYSWVDELNKRDLIGAGVVVGDDLVMFSIGLVSPQIPDAQMKNFKILVPRADGDPDEIDAVFQGRDERTNVAFVKPKTPQHWKPLKFEDVKVDVGQRVIAVGMLPQAAAFKAYVMETKIAAELRGDVPQVLVQGGLTSMGSPVFNDQGQAIGVVSFSPGQSILLNRSEDAMAGITSPGKFFVPARDFLLSLADPPTPEKPILLPWSGVAQLTGLSKDVAEALNLKNKPAIQIGDVIPNASADKAGLKSGDIILALNGEPLERGDEASELPGIFRRRLLRHKIGEEVTFSILRGNETKPMDIKLKLAAQPKQANTAKRFFAEDLGFVVRELVFNDTYARKLPVDYKGVLVARERPQGASESAGLHPEDIIIRLNNEPVTDLAEFETRYKKIRKDKPRDAVVVVVQRRNNEDTIRIEPPQ